MNKNKVLSAALSAFLCVGLLAGCGSPAPGPTDEPAPGPEAPADPGAEPGPGPAPGEETGPQASGDTIRIGLNYELSGAVAQYGQACATGIEMAAAEINAAGGVNGKQLELIKLDNKSDNNESMQVATRLATRENVALILGPATSGAVKATTSVSDQYGVPVISCSATANDVTVTDGKLNEWVFRTCYSDNFQGSVMGDFAYNELGGRKAVVLSDKSNDYSQGLSASFKRSFHALTGEIVGEEFFSADDNDFSSVLTNIKGMDYDVIYLPAYYESVGPIIRQARAMDIVAPILGADGYDSEKMLELAGSAEALNGVYFTNHYSSGDPSPEVVQFVESFKAANGAEPNGFSALGYDLMYFAADAITRAGSEDRAAIRDALASTVDFPAVTGQFSIDENHDPVKSTVVIEFVGGLQTYRAKAGA